MSAPGVPEHPLEKLTPYLWRRGNNYLHWCQGCVCGHMYPTNRVPGPNWTFNDKPESPTFMPSMHIFVPQLVREDGVVVPQKTICHYHVIDGKIQYQPDCQHELKGQTLPLETIPPDYGF
jgi:hypothetical protein